MSFKDNTISNAYNEAAKGAEAQVAYDTQVLCPVCKTVWTNSHVCNQTHIVIPRLARQ